jgi:DNA invertase Pin-like site-specific DNA recombinase
MRAQDALRKERQAEGIARVKAPGIYKGRKAGIEAASVRARRARAWAQIARQLRITRANVYRLLGVDAF